MSEIEDPAGSGQSAALTQMILTAIAGTQKFTTLERGQMNQLLQEQARAKSGLVTSRTPGKTGGFQGADYLIYGTITTLSASKQSDFGATLGLALGASMVGARGPTTNCYGGKVTLSIDIRITDGATGQIRYVKRIDEMQKAGTLCGEGVPQVNATALLRTAADKIASGLVTSVYPMMVAAAQGDGTIIINYGEGTVKMGDQLSVFKPGMDVVDPATGARLGSTEEVMGIVQVTDVQTSFSKANPVAGLSTPPEPKWILRPTTDADRQRFQPSRRRRSSGE
ncbi:hypothetical protein GTZ99_13650 [Novosphingobium sp. FSY-8]|uniref:Curli production assembly/transport component CsgG n=1 Tax=Novosphingobium ovatum TaxID=1908523 RepID=A0ABW9XGK2_9SPHN|nr:hypothetical protein [Novosphingobium ovatum]